MTHQEQVFLCLDGHSPRSRVHDERRWYSAVRSRHGDKCWCPSWLEGHHKRLLCVRLNIWRDLDLPHDCHIVTVYVAKNHSVQGRLLYLYVISDDLILKIK